jgi:hypothetical protein
MPATATIDTAEDLIGIVSGWSRHSTLAERYIRLLHEAATEGVTVGVLESVVEADALSDWEAASKIPDSIYPDDREGVVISDVADVREALCRSGPVVVAKGSRKGKPLYTLHPELIE